VAVAVLPKEAEEEPKPRKERRVVLRPNALLRRSSVEGTWVRPTVAAKRLNIFYILFYFINVSTK
jgi:hypothetical protein